MSLFLLDCFTFLLRSPADISFTCQHLLLGHVCSVGMGKCDADQVSFSTMTNGIKKRVGNLKLMGKLLGKAVISFQFCLAAQYWSVL